MRPEFYPRESRRIKQAGTSSRKEAIILAFFCGLV
jgi:hypothetical protein